MILKIELHYKIVLSTGTRENEQYVCIARISSPFLFFWSAFPRLHLLLFFFVMMLAQQQRCMWCGGNKRGDPKENVMYSFEENYQKKNGSRGFSGFASDLIFFAICQSKTVYMNTWIIYTCILFRGHDDKETIIQLSLWLTL